jgi:hypothetical protein
LPPAGEAVPGPAGERKRVFRLTSMGWFAAAFMLLCGAVGAVVAGQLAAKALGPWLSMGYSAGAVLCTIAAVVTGRRR